MPLLSKAKPKHFNSNILGQAHYHSWTPVCFPKCHLDLKIRLKNHCQPLFVLHPITNCVACYLKTLYNYQCNALYFSSTSYILLYIPSGSGSESGSASTYFNGKRCPFLPTKSNGGATMGLTTLKIDYTPNGINRSFEVLPHSPSKKKKKGFTTFIYSPIAHGQLLRVSLLEVVKFSRVFFVFNSFRPISFRENLIQIHCIFEV